jgi:hypothetical protein
MSVEYFIVGMPIVGAVDEGTATVDGVINRSAKSFCVQRAARQESPFSACLSGLAA